MVNKLIKREIRDRNCINGYNNSLLIMGIPGNFIVELGRKVGSKHGRTHWRYVIHNFFTRNNAH